VLDFLGNLKRTHYFGELRGQDDRARRPRDGLGRAAARSGNCSFWISATAPVSSRWSCNKRRSRGARQTEQRPQRIMCRRGSKVFKPRANPKPPGSRARCGELHILNNARRRLRSKTKSTRRKRRACASLSRLAPAEAAPEPRAAPQDHPGNSQSHGRDGFPRSGNAMLTRSTPEGRAIISCQPRASRAVLRAPQSPQIFQADHDDGASTATSRSSSASATKICAPTAAEFTQLDVEMSSAAGGIFSA